MVFINSCPVITDATSKKRLATSLFSEWADEANAVHPDTMVTNKPMQRNVPLNPFMNTAEASVHHERGGGADFRRAHHRDQQYVPRIDGPYM